MKTKAFTLIELLVIIAICGILAALLLGVAGGCSKSSGVRTGVVTKFSYKGIFKKSYEGELAMEGLVPGSNGSVANVWRFSVMDKKVAEVIDAHVGKKVKVRYEQTFFRNPFGRDTSYYVTAVEGLDAEAK